MKLTPIRFTGLPASSRQLVNNSQNLFKAEPATEMLIAELDNASARQEVEPRLTARLLAKAWEITLNSVQSKGQSLPAARAEVNRFIGAFAITAYTPAEDSELTQALNALIEAVG